MSLKRFVRRKAATPRATSDEMIHPIATMITKPMTFGMALRRPKAHVPD
jgi:hypothetical protein